MRLKRYITNINPNKSSQRKMLESSYFKIVKFEVEHSVEINPILRKPPKVEDIVFEPYYTGKIKYKKICLFIIYKIIKNLIVTEEGTNARIMRDFISAPVPKDWEFNMNDPVFSLRKMIVFYIGTEKYHCYVDLKLKNIPETVTVKSMSKNDKDIIEAVYQEDATEIIRILN